ncbi:MAG: hypothetical protein VCF24_25160, partial [Candidatus Latescibacterota bacterium]
GDALRKFVEPVGSLQSSSVLSSHLLLVRLPLSAIHALVCSPSIPRASSASFGGLASSEGFLLFIYYWACGVSGGSAEGCVFEGVDCTVGSGFVGESALFGVSLLDGVDLGVKLIDQPCLYIG